MKQNKDICAQGAGRAMSGQSCCFCLLVVRGQSYIVWCVPLMDNRRTTKKAGRKKDKPRWGQRQSAKTNSRPQQGCGFPQRGCGFVVHCFGVIRCDISMIYRDTSRYRIPMPIFWTDIEISYPVERHTGETDVSDQRGKRKTAELHTSGAKRAETRRGG